MASRKKSRSASNFAVGIALIIFIVMIIIWGYARLAPTASTQTVFTGETTETIPAKGIAVFEEELMTSQNKGIPVINYADGERIVAKTHVASLYTGTLNEGTGASLSELNERINYLETNVKNLQENKKNAETLSDSLINKMKQVAYHSVSGSFESIQRENAEIKSIISTTNSGDISQQLEELKKQRQDFENSIPGNKEDYISKSAGVVYSILDGYEKTITPKTIKDCDASSFETLWNSKPSDYSKDDGDFVYGKIINNFEVTVLTLLNSKDLSGISEGQTVYIEFGDRNTEAIPAIVQTINNSGKKALVTLNVSRKTEEFTAERKFECRIIKKIHQGLKIRVEALKTAGDNGTVLVIKDNIVKRKKVKVLSKKDDYAIVEENNALEDNLFLFDLVVVKAKNLSEGQVITDYK